MEKITSVSNVLVKETAKLSQKKYREETRKFLLEGFKPLSEAFACDIDIEYVFVNENHLEKYDFIRQKVIPTTEAVLKKISTTENAPEAVGVAVQKQIDTKDIRQKEKVLLVENIKDAGNLGTILRTSAAFGVELIVLFGDCVDLYNPKVVRSAVGCLWKVPVFQTADLNFVREQFKNHAKIATLPLSKNNLSHFKAEPPFVVMFGSEADGLSRELIDIADQDIKIEMRENVESLNLSISCGIVLYKLLIN